MLRPDLRKPGQVSTHYRNGKPRKFYTEYFTAKLTDEFYMAGPLLCQKCNLIVVPVKAQCQEIVTLQYKPTSFNTKWEIQAIFDEYNVTYWPGIIIQYLPQPIVGDISDVLIDNRATVSEWDDELVFKILDKLYLKRCTYIPGVSKVIHVDNSEEPEKINRGMFALKDTLPYLIEDVTTARLDQRFQRLLRHCATMAARIRVKRL
jgi:hypothetical protein